MMRSLLASGAVMTLLLAAPLAAVADDTAAPATNAQSGETNKEGCMPGGGCCGGSTACPKTPRNAEGMVTGGCPCQKAKAAAQQGSQQPANP